MEEKKKEQTKKIMNQKTIMVGGVIAIVVILAILLVVIALMADSPEKSVERMLTTITSGNDEQKMLSDLVGKEELSQEAQQLIFEKLTWKIQSTKQEGDKATVEIEITNKDFKVIIGNYMQKVIQLAFSGQNVQEEEMTNYLMEELRNQEVQTITSNQSISLEKRDGQWQIVTEKSELVNVLLPGFNEAISAFN